MANTATSNPPRRQCDKKGLPRQLLLRPERNCAFALRRSGEPSRVTPARDTSPPTPVLDTHSRTGRRSGARRTHDPISVHRDRPRLSDCFVLRAHSAAKRIVTKPASVDAYRVASFWPAASPATDGRTRGQRDSILCVMIAEPSLRSRPRVTPCPLLVGSPQQFLFRVPPLAPGWLAARSGSDTTKHFDKSQVDKPILAACAPSTFIRDSRRCVQKTTSRKQYARRSGGIAIRPAQVSLCRLFR